MRPRDFWKAYQAIRNAEELGLECLTQEDFDALLEAAKRLYSALINSLLTKQCRDLLEADLLEEEGEEEEDASDRS